MTDTQTYCVYENQRWNPLSGYTSTGLPTDRYMWSDVSGKHKRTREHTKLLSRHWHWVSLLNHFAEPKRGAGSIQLREIRDHILHYLFQI